MSVHNHSTDTNLDISASEKNQNVRERGKFRSFLISLSIILCQFVQVCVLTVTRVGIADINQTIPYGAGINSGLAIGKDLGISQDKATWIVASYP